MLSKEEINKLRKSVEQPMPTRYEVFYQFHFPSAAGINGGATEVEAYSVEGAIEVARSRHPNVKLKIMQVTEFKSDGSFIKIRF